jgi:nucleoside-diphosphate-sugar epimerase
MVLERSAMISKQVLVTGSAGTIGRIIVRALIARGHRVRGFDRVANPELADQRLATITDAAAVHAAMSGCQVVIHLAGTPEEADFVTHLVPNNVIGPYHVLEAARVANVERVIVASSIRVGKLNDWDRHIVRVADGLAPHDLYSFTKAAGEVMGEMYARLYGLTVICARLGWVVRNVDEVKTVSQGKWHRGILLSHDDVARFLVGSSENELHFPTTTRFSAMFVASKPMDIAAVDVTEARAVTGFESQDVWPHGTPWVDAFRAVSGDDV